MKLPRWLGGGSRTGSPAPGVSARGGEVQRHLAEFVRTRTGVEGFLEPATTVTPPTLLLVAEDGEWTRRAVPDPAAAQAFAKKVGIVVYDVNLSGYPSSMREWNERQKQRGSSSS